MGSSCSCFFFSTNPRKNHDVHVFLSYCGDTRYNFTSHLRGAFRRNHIKTYIDTDLSRGNAISPALVSAIRKSKVAVIIFSEYFATSKWCLDEIAEIVECKRTRKQIVVPIFYHVDPKDVRNQTGVYAVAFEDNEKNNKNLEKVQTWREALTEAANLAGWHCSANEMEYELVEKIAKDVRTKMNCNRLHESKTGEEFQRLKDMLKDLYQKNKVTLEQTLHVWDIAKAANFTKDIGKACNNNEEIMRIIEGAYKKKNLKQV